MLDRVNDTKREDDRAALPALTRPFQLFSCDNAVYFDRFEQLRWFCLE